MSSTTAQIFRISAWGLDALCTGIWCLAQGSLCSQNHEPTSVAALAAFPTAKILQIALDVVS